MTNQSIDFCGNFTARWASAGLLTVVWLLAVPAGALDITWVGSGNTQSWDDPFNWSPQEVPGRLDQAIFNESSAGPTGQGQVQFDAPVEVGTLLFNNSPDFTFDAGLTSSGKLIVENEVLYNGTGVLRLSGKDNVYEFNALHQTNGVIEIGTKLLITVHNPDHSDAGTVNVGPGGVFRLRNDVNMFFDGSLPKFKLEGKFEGNGTVDLRGNQVGQFQNSGRLVPGASPGTITIEGDYIQSDEGELYMEIDGVQEGDFDLLVVTGNATLAGNLNFELGAKLEENEFIEFMQLGGTQTGQFDQVSTTGNSNVFMATGSSNYFTAESYNLGDMDRDHDTDREDIDAMVLGLRDQLAYLTLTAGVPLWESGDVHPPGSPDGDFDFDDVAELVAMELYPLLGSGSGSSLAADTQVPEPSPGLLLLVGGVISASRRGRRGETLPHHLRKRNLRTRPAENVTDALA
jgi:hypothetical protein